MVLETPLLKVSRPVAACSRCRAAKIKCDGKLPACSACEKTGKHAECANSNDHFARGKERSYVSTLETQIERLESRLKEARLRKCSTFSIPDLDQSRRPSDAPSTRTITPSTTSYSSANAARRKEALDIDDLVSDFGYLAVNAAARDFYGFTSAMSYARLILSACSKDQLPAGMVTPLPARNVATITIQHYLDNIYVLNPFFDESSLYYSLDAVYHIDQGIGFLVTPFDQWCVRMVLAIANASMSEQRGDPNYMEGVGHVSAALRYADQVLQPGAIPSVQALLFLVQYAMTDPHHFDSWSLIGAASRAMVDLGLHQDPGKRTPMNKAKVELRRRVYYGVYVLDRSTSIVQTRAFSFSDDSANVALSFPSSKPAERSYANSKWAKDHDQAIDVIKLRRMQSKWYTDLFQTGREPWTDPYPYIWDTCKVLAAWFTKISPTTSPQLRAYFELDLLYSYIYILAPSPRTPVIAPYAQNLIFEYCISYARLMTSLISSGSRRTPIDFYDAMRVYMTGRQFLDVIVSAQDRLLEGLIPELPLTSASCAPPPPLSSPTADIRANTARAVTCIKQLTECLGHFGLRWGYMSWRDRFEKDAEATKTALNQRMWELRDLPRTMSGSNRRPDWQHTTSSGSLRSDDGTGPPISSAYQHQQQSYHAPPPPPLQGARASISPQHSYQQQVNAYAPPQVPAQNYSSSQYPSPQYDLRPEPQQFANWHGLHGNDGAGQSHAAGGADEDEAIPPTMRPYGPSS